MAAIVRLLALPGTDPPAGAPPLLLPDPLPASPWLRIAMRYNVRRISKDGLRFLAEELFVAGAISRPDLLLLSLNREVLDENCPDWEYFETLGESGGQRDWIAEIETRLSGGLPNADYVRYLERLLSLLKRAADERTPAPSEPPRVVSITEHRPRTVLKNPA